MHNTYPLTHAQRGVFTECMRYPESVHYGLPVIVSMPKTVDSDRLTKCMEQMVNTFTNYNIQLVWENGEIRQCLRENRDFHVKRITCSNSDVEKYRDELIRPFDIFNEQLIRIMLLETEDSFVALLNFHHLCADGITLAHYAQTLSELYNNGTTPVEKFSIFDYALEQEAYDASPDHEKSAEFYKNRFAGRQYNPFPTKQPASPEGHALLECIDIPRNLVDDFCKENGVRPNFLLEASYNITLSAYVRTDSVSYLTLQHGRYSRPARGAHGMFISTIPVCIDIDANVKVIDFVRQFKAEMFNTVRNANYSLMDFFQLTGELPDTMYAYQGPDMKEKFVCEGKEYPIRQIRIGDNTTATFSVVVYEMDDSYQLRIECSDAYLDSKSLRSFGQSMKSCLENMVENPDASLSDVQFIGSSERNRLVHTTASLPLNTEPAYVPEAILRNATATPEKTAVVAYNTSLTYAELASQVRNVACHLINNGIVPGDFVAVQTGREAEFIVAALGIMMAGAAYLPVDPSYPADRIEFMLSDSNARLTLTTDIVKQWTSEDCPDVVLPTVDSSSAAYMIYTSGSTGTPKGVVISHVAFASFVASITQVLNITSSDRISCHSSFSFDASVEDLYPVLAAGGTLCLVPEELRRDIPGLAAWLRENNVSGGNYTTRFGQMLLASEDLPTLRYLVLGGEKMTVWPERNRGIDVFNTYGPTECTVDATYYLLTPSTDLADIPIGRPMPGVSALVCDHHGRLMPFEAEGELCLSGKQLADGYWQRPEKTDEVFRTLADGERIYRTGDIVRWDNANSPQLVYIRRDDGQVKFNGYRMELSDIETQLVNLPAITEAKVLVRKQGRMDILCAYFVATEQLNVADVREALSQVLPQYMIPSVFLQLDVMPVNAVGKLDASRLPEPVVSSRVKKTEADADAMPRNEYESALLKIAQQVTGRDDILVTDNVHDLGITSMQLIQMAVEASKCGLNVKMESASFLSTIRDLANAHTPMLSCWVNENLSGDVDVVISGTTSATQIRSYAEHLNRPVLLFMPLSDDFDGTLVELCKLYADTITEQLKGRNVNSFIGHSFGGEIAYRLAQFWQEQNGMTRDVILLDTTLQLPDISDFTEAEEMKQIMDKMSPSDRLFWDEYIKKAKLTSRLHDASRLKGYSGSLALYNALRRQDMFLGVVPYLKGMMSEEEVAQWSEFITKQAQMNADNWRAVHPSINVIDIEAGHFELLQLTDNKS